jgi:hypothetical protein
MAGRWVMWSCQTCWYAAIYHPSATDADEYPESFRLDPGEITGAPRTV